MVYYRVTSSQHDMCLPNHVKIWIIFSRHCNCHFIGTSCQFIGTSFLRSLLYFLHSAYDIILPTLSHRSFPHLTVSLHRLFFGKREAPFILSCKTMRIVSNMRLKPRSLSQTHHFAFALTNYAKARLLRFRASARVSVICLGSYQW